MNVHFRTYRTRKNKLIFPFHQIYRFPVQTKSFGFLKSLPSGKKFKEKIGSERLLLQNGQ